MDDSVWHFIRHCYSYYYNNLLYFTWYRIVTTWCVRVYYYNVMLVKECTLYRCTCTDYRRVKRTKRTTSKLQWRLVVTFILCELSRSKKVFASSPPGMIKNVYMNEVHRCAYVDATRCVPNVLHHQLVFT